MNDLYEIARRRLAGESVAEIAAFLHTSTDWVELVMSSDAYSVIIYDMGQRRSGNEQ